MKVIQYTVIGEKCIYDGDFAIDDRDLLLKCKFVNFGEKQNNYIYFGSIRSIKDIY